MIWGWSTPESKSELEPQDNWSFAAAGLCVRIEPEMSNHSHPATPTPRPGALARVACVLGLAGLFLGFSLIRSPIPGVNESHYLCKARHFWQPDWCRGDLFLESANPHAVFYAVFGWLTTRLSFEQTALLIRAGQSLLLAAGWLAVSVRCLGDQRRAIVSAVLFLLLHATGTWSGEWIIGGAESKVWAYGFLMLGMASAIDGRWPLAGMLSGLAVSFHPVVGCWGVVIAGTGWVLNRVIVGRLGSPPTLTTAPEGEQRSPLPTILLSGAIAFAAALPGLIPAVRSLEAPSPEVASQADFLQVSERLPHHLDPLTFSVRAWRDYALLLLIWGLARSRIRDRQAALQWMELAMGASLLIAVAGIAAAWGPRPIKEMPLWVWRVKIMKLYPFRLTDMLIPMTLAMTLAAIIGEWLAAFRSLRTRTCVVATVALLILLVAFRVPSLDRTLSQQPAAVQRDWLAACRWIRERTPADANLYAANDNWSLRWYAERPEYFHFKDCPQDAVSILEWHRRNWQIYNWKLAAFADGRVSRKELRELRDTTGITHLVSGRFGPLELTPVFDSPNVKVFELPKD